MPIRRRIRRAIAIGIAVVLPLVPVIRGRTPPPGPERPVYERRVVRPKGGEMLSRQAPTTRSVQKQPRPQGLGAGGKGIIPQKQIAVRPKRPGERIGSQSQPLPKRTRHRVQHRV